MDDKVEELIRRNRTLLRRAEVVRARTEALTNEGADRRYIVGRHTAPDQTSKDQDRLARCGGHDSPETQS